MSQYKDRRRYKRYKYRTEFLVSFGGKSYKAHTIDFSLGGLSISVEGKAPLSVGTVIDVKIKDLSLDIQGTVVWTKKAGDDLRVEIERSSIFGLLKHYCFSDILLDLQRSEKTGVLEIRSGPKCKRIYISNGDMVFAASNQEEDRLGEVLLKAGKITLDQYYDSVDVMKKTGKRQGTVLVELGYLNPKELVWAVTQQVEEIILNLFQWEEGEFELKEGPLPSEELITLEISAANLIYRGTRKIDRFHYLSKFIPPSDAILYYSADPLDLFQDISLDQKDKELLSLINGTRTLKEILSLSPLNNFQSLKTLYALLSSRILEIREEAHKPHIEDKIYEEVLKEPEVKIDSAFIERVEELYTMLATSDYYAMLGVTKWSTPDEIKRAYYKKAKEFHPDRHFSLPSETLKNKFNALFSAFTVAYKTLSDPKTRGEYDRTPLPFAAPAEGSNAEKAKLKFKEGEVAYKKKAFTDAAELFGQAIYLDRSVADYHFHLGLAFWKQKKFRESGEAIGTALKLDPYNAEYMAELGHIYLELGFESRAKAAFEKAKKYDPSNERAAEGLKKVGYSS